MSGVELESSWLVQLITTVVIVMFGLWLIKRGAVSLYGYFTDMEKAGTDPLTRNLVFGITQAAVGVLLIVSFLTSSPLAFIFFTMS